MTFMTVPTIMEAATSMATELDSAAARSRNLWRFEQGYSERMVASSAVRDS